ncbi:MAG: glucose-6-phosphate isomerase [Clostridia bacterium]|nr:glucose-6-phosphate isomerase [Clostridia bacterium]
MSDLTGQAGFPLRQGEDGRLDFDPGWLPDVPSHRDLAAMRPVLFEPAADGPDPLYTMYRDVAAPRARPLLKTASLRFDLTVLAPGTVGPEWVKTFGHYHPTPPGAGFAYPEVYQVLVGRACFLLQRRDTSEDVVDVAAVVAEPGDVVIMPPGYGHVTLNVGEGNLVMANWVERHFASEYGPYRRRRGAAYYGLADGSGRGLPVRWLPNPAYGAVPPVRQLRARELPTCGLRHGESLYTRGVAEPDALAFLVRPELAEETWSRVWGG